MVKQTTLKNGLRVLAVPQHETEAITVMVLVPVGSRYENPSNNGISHFLEHLLFKGTKKRPSTLEITKLLDGVGAEYNAYTDKDHTAYYIKIAAKHFELAIDLFSDMLFNSLFDTNEIQRERGVILEELNMYEDNPLMYVDVLLESSVFGKQNPLGYDIGGLKKNIKQLPRSAFMKFKQTHYSPKRMCLVLTGNLPRNTQTLVKKYFEQYPNHGKTTQPKKFTASQTKPRFINKKKDTQQVQLCMGFTALPYRHKDLPTLQVLSTILGENMSSRLFISIREREGLCYVIRTSVNSYTDTGAFTIQAGLDKQRLQPAMKAITRELRRIKQELVSEEELVHAKQYIQGQMALRLEDSSAVAAWYGRQAILTKQLISPSLKYKEIQKVTRQDVQRLANSIFTTEHVNIASIGPFASIQSQLAKLIKF